MFQARHYDIDKVSGMKGSGSLHIAGGHDDRTEMLRRAQVECFIGQTMSAVQILAYCMRSDPTQCIRPFLGSKASANNLTVECISL